MFLLENITKINKSNNLKWMYSSIVNYSKFKSNQYQSQSMYDNNKNNNNKYNNNNNNYYDNNNKYYDNNNKYDNKSSNFTWKRHQYKLYEINNEKLNNFMGKNQPILFDDWLDIRQTILNSNQNVNEINIDSLIMDLCHPNGNIKVGKSYIQFLKDSNIRINSATIGKFLKLYYQSTMKNNNTIMAITKNDENDIKKIYDDLLETYKLLDSITCGNLIYALTITKQYWKESFKLLEMIKITCTPPSSIYSQIISTSFLNNELDIGWTLLNEMIKVNRLPRCNVFISYFKYCQRQYQNDKTQFIIAIEKMLEFIGDHGIIVSKEVCDNLLTVLQEFKFSTNYINISTNGQCNSCNNQLDNVLITNNEFEQLSSTFLKKVLIREDIFLKSNPRELNEYTKFLDKTRPYDCVIDGLNVSFSIGKANPKSQARALATVVKHFLEHNKKILILGRKHMNGWPTNQMNFIRNNAHCFFTDNLSHDDPYLLYAALKSGPKTDILSRDLMRSHLFLLGNELKPIFRRWQQQHQYVIKYISNMDEVKITNPIRFNINAHKIVQKNIWHIPYVMEYVPNPPNLYDDIPTDWLCISLK